MKHIKYLISLVLFLSSITHANTYESYYPYYARIGDIRVVYVAPYKYYRCDRTNKIPNSDTRRYIQHICDNGQ